MNQTTLLSSEPYHNRLQYENSPYLLQHAGNPVDWYPWNEEAFAKAQKENKPIFLSIGYSTCHWCHVMERESFEDQEVARLLNKNFVSIKVDREERPDIDTVYMSVCQSLTGSGGWPLTIIMTPNQKPFYAGTYFPKHSQRGNLGLMELLQTVADTWIQEPKKLQILGQRITATLQKKSSRENENSGFIREDLEQAVTYFSRRFDSCWGGFGGAPKFPSPHQLLFLMDYANYNDEGSILAMAEKTLEAMAAGGIRDHIGGGFARYSTDTKWLIPHFEKMLYDNAFLAMAYLKAFQLTEKQQYATVAEEIFSFIKKDMTNKQGGFYSALDADINGEEGKFYIFSPREIIEVLGETDGQSFCQCYNITDQGNFEGASVPNRIGNHEPLPQNLVAIKEALYRYRNLRHRLHCDDKALTAWNGMMIAALADGYRILGKDEYLQQGENAFAFAEQHLTHDDGTLAVHWRKGKATGQGFLDDYCYMAYAAIALYRATLKLSYLEKASNLAETILNRFWDESNGGCFLYEETAQALILRPKEYYDGALPSGNSIFLSVLADLSAITGEYHWMEPAQKQAAFLKQQICSYPQISPMALSAAMTLIYPSRRAVFVTESPRECSTILAQSRTIRRPNTHIICKPECTDSAPEFLQKYQCIHGQTTCYLCDGSQCSAPTNDMDAVWSLLQ